jgi:hypothetical protein
MEMSRPRCGCEREVRIHEPAGLGSLSTCITLSARHLDSTMAVPPAKYCLLIVGALMVPCEEGAHVEKCTLAPCGRSLLMKATEDAVVLVSDTITAVGSSVFTVSMIAAHMVCPCLAALPLVQVSPLILTAMTRTGSYCVVSCCGSG